MPAGRRGRGRVPCPSHALGRYVRDVVRPAIDAGARANGRDGAKLELYAPAFTVTGETEAERSASEREVRRQIAFYASTPNYRALLEYHGLGGIGKELSALMRQGEFDAMPRLVPDSLVEDVAVVAPPAEVAAALRRRYEGLLDRVSLYFPFPRALPSRTGRASSTRSARPPERTPP